MGWTPNPANLARERSRWLRQHYARRKPRGDSIDDFLPEAVTAGFAANDLLPMLDELKMQGYSLESREEVAELLDQMSEFTLSSYVREQVDDQEWREFLDLTSMAATVQKPRAREVAERAQALGMNVAGEWVGDDGIKGKVEFNEEMSRVGEFKTAMEEQYPDCRFTIEKTKYNVPTLWITPSDAPKTAMLDIKPGDMVLVPHPRDGEPVWGAVEIAGTDNTQIYVVGDDAEWEGWFDHDQVDQVQKAS